MAFKIKGVETTEQCGTPLYAAPGELFHRSIPIPVAPVAYQTYPYLKMDEYFDSLTELTSVIISLILMIFPWSCTIHAIPEVLKGVSLRSNVN